MNRRLILVLGTILAVALLAVVAVLLVIQFRGGRVETVRPFDIPSDETSPTVWGRAFPREFDTWNNTKIMRKTRYAGSVPFDRLEQDPRLRILLEGNLFSVEWGEDRGHAFSIDDVLRSERRKALAQRRGGTTPGACWNCKSAETPKLIAEMGAEQFYASSFEQLYEDGKIKNPVSCNNCHNSETLELEIKLVSLQEGLRKLGRDSDAETTGTPQSKLQQMRTLACAQCHVEYYFAKEPKDYVIYPWDNGTRFEDIERYYNDRNFSDWIHPSTGVRLVKFQHPEFEFYTANSTHFLAGVACADCHMPFVVEGGVKFSSHQAASPWADPERSCGGCHSDIDFVRTRAESIQDTVKDFQDKAEIALVDAVAALKAIKDNENADPELAEEARTLFRKAHMRWDFVASENSLGFHNPQEALRLLGDSQNFARQAQIKALQATQTQ